MPLTSLIFTISSSTKSCRLLSATDIIPSSSCEMPAMKAVLGCSPSASKHSKVQKSTKVQPNNPLTSPAMKEILLA